MAQRSGAQPSAQQSSGARRSSAERGVTERGLEIQSSPHSNGETCDENCAVESGRNSLNIVDLSSIFARHLPYRFTIITCVFVTVTSVMNIHVKIQKPKQNNHLVVSTSRMR